MVVRAIEMMRARVVEMVRASLVLTDMSDGSRSNAEI